MDIMKVRLRYSMHTTPAHGPQRIAVSLVVRVVGKFVVKVAGSFEMGCNIVESVLKSP